MSETPTPSLDLTPGQPMVVRLTGERVTGQPLDAGGKVVGTDLVAADGSPQLRTLLNAPDPENDPADYAVVEVDWASLVNDVRGETPPDPPRAIPEIYTPGQPFALAIDVVSVQFKNADQQTIIPGSTYAVYPRAGQDLSYLLTGATLQPGVVY